MITTAALNTENFKTDLLPNILKLQILVKADEGAIYKTVSFFPNQQFLGYSSSDLQLMIINQINKLNATYQDAYT